MTAVNLIRRGPGPHDGTLEKLRLDAVPGAGDIILVEYGEEVCSAYRVVGRPMRSRSDNRLRRPGPQQPLEFEVEELDLANWSH